MGSASTLRMAVATLTVAASGGLPSISAGPEPPRQGGPPPPCVQEETGGPCARLAAGMAFDARHGSIVLFGGKDDFGTPLGDTWLFDGASWAPATPTMAPSPRHSTRMVYDPANGNVLLFGGDTGLAPPPGCPADVQGDTWIWNGSDWLEQHPATSPSPRASEDMSMDGTVVPNRIIMFGGYGRCGALPPSLTDCGDTWFWDGTNWTECPDECADHPSDRSSPAMDFDPSRNAVVLFGGKEKDGLVSQTWAWDGTSWDGLFGIGSPSARNGHRMVYDPVNREMVMFGGHAQVGGHTVFLDDTWHVRARWGREAPVHSPSPRCCVGLGYFAGALHRVVLFGGLGEMGALADTWLWDGSDWCQVGVSCG